MIKLISFILILFMGCPNVWAFDNQNFQLMIYGDSLSAGYRLPEKDAFYSQLEKTLKDKGYSNISVLNFSKSGETTTGGVARLHNALTYKPDAVLLELGINDALRDVDITTIQRNLETMIITFQNAGAPVMLIGMQVPPTKEQTYQNDFNEMYRYLSQKYHLTLYPFFMNGLFDYTLDRLNFNTAYLQADHVHPTKEGVQVMVKNILPTVQEFLKQFQ